MQSPLWYNLDMSGKQTYFGKVKKIDSRAQRKTLSELYNEAESIEKPKKPAEEPKEKPVEKPKKELKTEKVKPEKAPKKPKRERHVVRTILIILLILAVAGAAALVFFGMGRRETVLGDTDSATTEADELYYSRLTGG